VKTEKQRAAAPFNFHRYSVTSLGPFSFFVFFAPFVAPGFGPLWQGLIEKIKRGLPDKRTARISAPMSQARAWPETVRP
jgi:hypothetical protein